jgi:DNA-binding CsgD family transcriptional regulator
MNRRAWSIVQRFSVSQFGWLPDALPRLRHRLGGVLTDEFRTGDPLLIVDPALTVTSWNRSAERLTGVLAAEALGRRCWEVLGGIGEAGDLICHAGCSNARLAREGFPVPCHAMFIRTDRSRRRVTMSTVALGDGRLLHVLTADAPRRNAAVALTPRQRETLELMAAGLQAKAIAARLMVTETTVRTYIRAILRELGAHSQLEALAKARDCGLLRV